MLDDPSQEMRCFQNKSINLFLLQRWKVINAYSQVLIWYAILDRPPKNRLLGKSTLYEQDRTFHLSQFLVLEYQRNTGSKNLVLEYQI